MSARKSIEQTFFEQARAQGMDHAEAWEWANDRAADHARRAGEAAATQEITVTVKGDRYTVSGAMIDRIRFDRNQATVYRQGGDAPAEIRTRTELRNHVMRSFGVNADTAAMILAAVRQAPVTGWRPDSLDLAVQWDKGWKIYQVTGTRHAYFLLRKLARREGFWKARLNDVIVRKDGMILDNVITITQDDILGRGDAGAYASFLNRHNTNYDLQRDESQG